MEEHHLTCPYCWETISMLFDPSVSQQEYVEDCEVCCNPIYLNVTANNGVIVNLEPQVLGQ